MTRLRILRGAAAFGLSLTLLLSAVPAPAADLIEDVEEAYRARGLSRTPFSFLVSGSLDRDEARFLNDLFALTDEASLLNLNVGRWLFAGGDHGLHVVDYLERVDALGIRVEELEAPARVGTIRDLISEALRLQRGFVKDWYVATEEGRPFESQMTDEYAYHDGLDRSHRALLRAYAELYALFPDVGQPGRLAFRNHLRAVDWE